MEKINKNQLICPLCGSLNVDSFSKEESYTFPFGANFSFNAIYNVCKECGADGDFAKKNDLVFEDAQKSALTKSVNSILENLSQKGIGNAQIERTLGLPPRTLARWKSGIFSDAAIALLRIIATYPWVLEVAKQGYNRRDADAALIIQAGIVIANNVDKKANNS